MSHLRSGKQRPEVVVGLAASVVELDLVPADLHPVDRLTLTVGTQRVDREEARRAERLVTGTPPLSPPPIVSWRSPAIPPNWRALMSRFQSLVYVVPVEALGDVLVADDDGLIVGEERAAADVIGVAVGVHEVADRLGAPPRIASTHGLPGAARAMRRRPSTRRRCRRRPSG